jgi:hypothetical protein
MSKRIPSPESAHLKTKLALYESFLFGYLPQLTALSFVTRINLLDAFSQGGLNRAGSQGTPFIVYQAIHKQRQHQLRKQLPLKPFSFSLLSPPESPALPIAFEALQAANQESNSCKLALWPLGISDGIKQFVRQQQAQPASERNLLLLDPLEAPFNFIQELRRLTDKKTALILPLPLAALWQLHQKPEKEPALAGCKELKQALDACFPPEHVYWSPENTVNDFAAYLKDLFSMDGLFFSALEPAPAAAIPPMVLLGLSADAFMMEKLLQALQGLRPAKVPAVGAQLGLFLGQPNISDNNHCQEAEALVLQLLQEEKDNQALYTAGLQAGLLPTELQEELERLSAAGKIEVLNEKGKPMSGVPKVCISFTAFKAPKPVCSFRVKA